MKKSIPKVRERESEASILGNDREREFPLTPGSNQLLTLDSYTIYGQRQGSAGRDGARVKLRGAGSFQLLEYHIIGEEGG